MQEEWKPVVGYEGLYEVSNMGKVRNASNKHVLAAHKASGYYIVLLCRPPKNSKVDHKTWLVHRLVAIAFIANPEGLPQVDHINGDRTDNNVTNLRWVTCRDNHMNPVTYARSLAAHRTEASRLSSKARLNTPEVIAKRNTKLRSADNRRRLAVAHGKRVRCLETGKIYISILEAAKDYNTSRWFIKQSCAHGNIDDPENDRNPPQLKHHFQYNTI